MELNFNHFQVWKKNRLRVGIICFHLFTISKLIGSLKRGVFHVGSSKCCREHRQKQGKMHGVLPLSLNLACIMALTSVPYAHGTVLLLLYFPLLNVTYWDTQWKKRTMHNTELYANLERVCQLGLFCILFVVDGPSCHGDAALFNLQESWGLVQRGAAAAGRFGPYCRQRWV